MLKTKLQGWELPPDFWIATVFMLAAVVMALMLPFTPATIMFGVLAGVLLRYQVIVYRLTLREKGRE